MKRSMLLLLSAVLAVSCSRDQSPTAARMPRSIAYGANSEEELIGGVVYGAASTTWFHASSIEDDPIGGYFNGLTSKNRWGVFIADCPDSEAHRPDTLHGPSGSEEHCLSAAPGHSGIYSVTVSQVGGTTHWTRTLGMLDTLGTLDNVTNGRVYHDVYVPFDVTTPTTTLSGTLRASTTYHAATDTASFSTSSPTDTLTTGAPVWFISTFVSKVGGTLKYAHTDIINSYNFAYGAGGVFQPGVNSVDALDGNRGIPFRHIYRSPGGVRTYTARVRVIEPYQLAMDSGRLDTSTIALKVKAQPACMRSFSGYVNQTTHFSAGCSDATNQAAAASLYQWVWSSTAGDTSAWSADTSASHTFTTGGSKTVKLRIQLISGEGGMDSTSSSGTVLDPPTVAFTDSQTISAKHLATCTWQVTTSGGASPVTVNWYAGTTSVGTGTTLHYRVTQTSTFTMWAKAVDANGLRDSTSGLVTIAGSGPNCQY